MEIKNPFETIKSEKIKLGRFNVVQDEVRINGNVRPYDYLEMLEGVSILPFHFCCCLPECIWAGCVSVRGRESG